MPRFLIDANLPYYFSLWHGDEFIHQKDIDDTWTDEQIWDYATINDLVIVTKDSDFSHRIIFHTPPPKVVHIRFGNMKLHQFYFVVRSFWSEATLLLENNKLITIYRDRIEALS